ncbi:hypothetical protein BD779DRAFT_1680813 [Infundibulicybe gibba]|nr:hypothetical protein BD779DRAFT_1680813 [Infundibulicybe gibba]
MKEKRLLETGALLGALSDSQRTMRVLREEDAALRLQLDTAKQDNMGLKRELGELKGLVRNLEDRELRGIGHARGFGMGGWKRERDGKAVWNPHAHSISRLGFCGSNDNPQDAPPTRTNLLSHFISREVHLLVLDDLDFHSRHPHSQPASSTPNTKRHRRMSTASSVSLLPVSPANMTVLLHNNARDLATSTPTKLQHVYHPRPAAAPWHAKTPSAPAAAELT